MATIRPIKRQRGEAYQLDYTDPTTGKRYRKTMYCDYKTAITILKELEARMARKEYGIEYQHKKHLAWREHCNNYLVQSSKTKAAATTKREQFVINAFSKYIGDPDIQDINLDRIQDYIYYRLNTVKISAATASIEIRVLKTIFNYAIKLGILEDNPVKRILLPRPKTIRVRYLLVDEIDRFISVISPRRLRDLALLYLSTGARRAELLPPLFTWENVKFENRMISLTGKGNVTRYIPMNSTSYHLLKRIIDTGAEVPFNFRPDTITHKFHTFFKLAGVRGANVHSLRKTFGSLLMQNGKADLYTVSKLLGHKSIKTTEQYYVDLLDENYQQSVNYLDSILSALTL